MNWKEIAKFLCGFEAFPALFHASLWISGSTFVAFGFSTTPGLNVFSLLLSGVIALWLDWFGWRRRHHATDTALQG